MSKLELLRSIERLSEIIHDEAMVSHFSEKTIAEIRSKLDELSEKYLEMYCNA
ncbi:MAG: hypothetical protein GX348_01270 [Veillonellaceae bacterium]|nr:hypothetical protein [Veillonellaceae bacterium]